MQKRRMSSTFDGLFIARSGVRAARANLNVTGQNITNSTTSGYTRQRVNQSAITPPSLDSFYSGTGEAVCGQGADADSTVQLRDAFLDGEYRVQNAESGESSALLSALSPLEDIFSYSTTAADSDSSSVVDVLDNALGDFVSQLQNLTSGKSDAAESVIRDAADLLTKKFNTASKLLETAWNQQAEQLSDYAVPEVNDLLQGIADLDGRIEDAENSGGSALELRDQRNLKLDELSKYLDLRVEEKDVEIGAGKTVPELCVFLADRDGNALLKEDGSPEFTLVSGESCASFSIDTGTKESGEVLLSLNSPGAGGENKDFSNADLASGSLAGCLKVLNENGEYDIREETGDTASFRGIGYYRKLLDTLAQTFAQKMNSQNATGDEPVKPLFTSGGSDAVTAGNIQLSADWTIGSGYLTTSTEGANPGDSTDTSYSNITAMIAALTSDKIDFKTPDGVVLLSGTIQKAFMDVPDSLGRSVSGISQTDSDNSNRLENIDSSRQSISSVSVDDEAISLVQFNEALQASARFMTAVDECLQTIINSMGIAGRG